MNTYSITLKPFVAAGSNKTAFSILRDLPEGVEPPVQIKFLDEVMGMFLRVLVKVYAEEDLSVGDREKLKRLLNKIFEAKDAIMAKEPKNGGRF